MGSRGLRASAHPSQGAEVMSGGIRPTPSPATPCPSPDWVTEAEGAGCWDDQGALPGEDTPGFLSEENEKHEDRPGGSTGRTALGGCPRLYLCMSACIGHVCYMCDP